MPRHRKPDRVLTAYRRYADKDSFVDVHGLEYLRGADMATRRLEVYRRDAGRCMLIVSPRCRGWANWEDGELDHIMSRGKGGSDDASNLRWACKPCHRYRHVHPRWGESRAQAIKDFEKLYEEAQ